MGMKTLKQGEDFSFPPAFGFTGSSKGNVNPRSHPTMSDDEFGDGTYLAQKSDDVPTLARGGKLPGTAAAAPKISGTVSKKKAASGVLKALALGKAIGQKTGAAGASPPPAMTAGLPPGAGPGMPAPAGAIPAMKKGGRAKKWAAEAFKPSHKGRLHKALHVPLDEKIPAGKMQQAKHSKNPHVRQMAQAARNINK